MAGISLRAVITESLINRFSGLATKAGSGASSPLGGSHPGAGQSSNVNFSAGLRIGARAFGNAVQGLNSLIGALKISDQSLEDLLDLTEEMIKLAERATKGGGASYDTKFRKLIKEFHEIIEDSVLGERNLLNSEDLLEIFQTLGLSPEDSEAIKKLFEEFVLVEDLDVLGKGKVSINGKQTDLDPFLAAETIKNDRPHSIPAGAFTIKSSNGADLGPISQVSAAAAQSGLVSTGYSVYQADDGSGNQTIFIQSVDGSVTNALAVTSAAALKAINQKDGYSVIQSSQDFLGFNAGNFDQLFLVNSQGNVIHQFTNNAGSEIYGAVDIAEDNLSIAYADLQAGGNILKTVTAGGIGQDPAAALQSSVETLAAGRNLTKVQISDDGTHAAFIEENGSARTVHLYDLVNGVLDAELLANSADSDFKFLDANRIAILRETGGGSFDLIERTFDSGGAAGGNDLGALSKVSDADAQAGFIAAGFNVYQADNGSGLQTIYFESTDGVVLNSLTVTANATLKAVDEHTGFAVIESSEDFLGYNPANQSQLFLVNNQGAVLLQYTDNPGTQTYGSVDISKDLLTIAFARTNGDDALVTVTAGEFFDDPLNATITVVETLAAGENASKVKISDDGNFAAFVKEDGGNYTIHYHDLVNGTSDSGLMSQTGDVDFSFADGNRLLILREDGAKFDVVKHAFTAESQAAQISDHNITGGFIAADSNVYQDGTHLYVFDGGETSLDFSGSPFVLKSINETSGYSIVDSDRNFELSDPENEGALFLINTDPTSIQQVTYPQLGTYVQNGHTFTGAEVTGIGKPTAYDIDGDTNLDLIYGSSAGLSVRLGNGDGTFDAERNSALDASGAYSSHTVANVNGDAFLDVIVMDGAEEEAHVMLGDGSGYFSTAQKFSFGAAFDDRTLVSGDFDSDTDVDFAVFDRSNDALNVFLGNGDGTFSIGGSFSITDPHHHFVEVGFIDGDGNLDLFYDGGGSEFLLKGNGDGTFQAQVTVSSLGNSKLADVNNDTFLDIVTNSELALGNGDGTFNAASGIGFNFAVGQFNSDANLDLIGETAAGTLIRYGNGDGTFSAAETSFVPTYLSVSDRIVAADFTGDGLDDFYFLSALGHHQFWESTTNSPAPPTPINFEHAASSEDGKKVIFTETVGTTHKVRLATIDSIGDSPEYVTYTDLDSVDTSSGITFDSVAISNDGSYYSYVKKDGSTENVYLIDDATKTPDAFLSTQDIRYMGFSDANSLFLFQEDTANYDVYEYTYGDGALGSILVDNAALDSYATLEKGVQPDGHFAIQDGLVTTVYNSAGSVVYTYTAGGGDAISSISLAHNAEGDPDLGIVGVLSSVNGDSDTELYRVGAFSGGDTTLLNDIDAAAFAGIEKGLNATGFFAVEDPLGKTVKVYDDDGTLIDTSALLGADSASRLSMARNFAGSAETGIFGTIESLDDDADTELYRLGSLNYGDGTFPAPASMELGLNAEKIIDADFNGDGFADLLFDGASEFGIRLGNGDGTFAALTTFATGATLQEVRTADMNGDGYLDVIAAEVGSSAIAVALGNGDGTFQDRLLFSAGTAVSYQLEEGDFNNDGLRDIAVSDALSGNISVLLGNGDGTLKASATFDVSASASSAIAIADITGDGIEDILFGAQDGGNFVRYIAGNGDGTFKTFQELGSSGSIADEIRIVDLDRDGDADVLSRQGATGFNVWLGNNDGTFTAAQSFAASTSADEFSLVDLNGDLLLDIAGIGMQVLLGNGDGTFKSFNSFAATGATFTAGDFDNDGVVDFASTESGALNIMLGNGNASARQTGSAASAAETTLLSGVSAGRLAAVEKGLGNTAYIALENTDTHVVTIYDENAGALDTVELAESDVLTNLSIAKNFAGGAELGIYGTVTGLNDDSDNELYRVIGENRGDGTFGAALSFDAGGADRYQPKLGDLNGDGKLDIVSSDRTNNQVRVQFGNGDGTFLAAFTYAISGSDPVDISISDFNGDGALDLGVLMDDSDAVEILENDGAGNFTTSGAYSIQSGDADNYGLLAADIDNDGDNDLVAGGGNNPASPISVLIANGDGTFKAPAMYSGAGATAAHLSGISDLTGDGWLDLLAHGQFFTGNGDGTFNLAVQTEAGNAQVAADFNLDGFQDIAGAQAGGDLTVQLGNGDGTFNAAATVTTGFVSTRIDFHDINGDGIQDLIHSSDTGDHIAINIGNGDGTFKLHSTHSTGASGANNGFALGDLDGDGVADLVTDLGAQAGRLLAGSAAAEVERASSDRQLSRKVQEFDSIFSNKRSLSRRPDAHRILHDLKALHEQIEKNREVLEDAISIITDNIELVRSAGFAFLNLSDTLKGTEKAAEVAQKLRAEIRTAPRSALNQLGNLEALAVAGLALDEDNLLA